MPFKRKLAAILAIVLLAVCCAIPAAAGTLTGDQVILSWTLDPCSTQTFTWKDDPGSGAFVQYVDQGQYKIDGFASALAVYGSPTLVRTTDSGYYRFEATAVNLTPSTTYYYRVGNSSGSGAAGTFTTAPVTSENYSFLFMGDIQEDIDIQTEAVRWGALLQSAYNRNSGMAFGIIGGDLVQSGTKLSDWNAILDNAAPVFSKIPLMPTNGNHESNFPGGKPQSYLDVFALPENGPSGFEEEFYSFDYGTCHVTVLNSHVYSGEQGLGETDYAVLKAWIKNDLAASKALWKFVVLHHPPYAVANDNVSALVKSNWTPIFEEEGVDMVFMGHQHVYARSMPLYQNEYNAEKGIVYVMGVSGSKFYSSANESNYEKVIYNTSNYQVIEIDGAHLYLKTCNAAGALLDYCILYAKDRQNAAVYGDLNEDGVVGLADVRLVLAHVLSKGEYMSVMDINEDGIIDVRDAQEILLIMRSAGGGI